VLYYGYSLRWGEHHSEIRGTSILRSEGSSFPDEYSAMELCHLYWSKVCGSRLLYYGKSLHRGEHHSEVECRDGSGPDAQVSILPWKYVGVLGRSLRLKVALLSGFSTPRRTPSRSRRDPMLTGAIVMPQMGIPAMEFLEGEDHTPLAIHSPTG